MLFFLLTLEWQYFLQSQANLKVYRTGTYPNLQSRQHQLFFTAEAGMVLSSVASGHCPSLPRARIPEPEHRRPHKKNC